MRCEAMRRKAQHVPTLTAVRLSSSEALLPVATVLPPVMLKRLLLLFAGRAMALAGRCPPPCWGEVGGEFVVMLATELMFAGESRAVVEGVHSMAAARRETKYVRDCFDPCPRVVGVSSDSHKVRCQGMDDGAGLLSDGIPLSCWCQTAEAALLPYASRS